MWKNENTIYIIRYFFSIINMIVYNTYKQYNTPIEESGLTPENQEYLDNLKKHGAGIFNDILRKVPLPEMHLHLPNDVSSENISNGSFNNTGKYSFCGPGTKVQKRINEGYQGVNNLDKACKQHDISYSKNKSTKERNVADDILANRASQIALDPNEPNYVRKDAKLVTGIMGMKSRFGLRITKNL